MANETIMLAVTYSGKQKCFPAIVTEKLDGVAVDLYIPHGSKEVLARSRDNEPYVSVPHVQHWLKDKLKPGDHLVCELYIPGKRFKEISGLARRQEPCPDMLAFVYDFYQEGKEDTPYVKRMKLMAEKVAVHCRLDTPVQFINGTRIETREEFDKFYTSLIKMRPKVEGVVIRKITGEDMHYQAAWRSPGMIKLKQVQSRDLQIVSFEEAIDKKTKKGNGMVGRINCMYRGKVIGVGPGKMPHDLRKEVWTNQKKYLVIAEVVSMPDDSYDALREPRFYRFRFDKKTPNEEV